MAQRELEDSHERQGEDGADVQHRRQPPAAVAVLPNSRHEQRQSRRGVDAAMQVGRQLGEHHLERRPHDAA